MFDFIYHSLKNAVLCVVDWLGHDFNNFVYKPSISCILVAVSTGNKPLVEVYPGLNNHRLRPEAGNYAEVLFAEAWLAENSRKTSAPILSRILTRFDPHEAKTATISDRDKAVAASVVQWLGSPVGFQFVRNVMRQIENGG